MTDFTKTCWSCGSSDLEKKNGYVQCASCGATYNEVSELGPPIVEPGNVIMMQGGKPVKIRSQHPTPGVKRRAAKAR